MGKARKREWSLLEGLVVYDLSTRLCFAQCAEASTEAIAFLFRARNRLTFWDKPRRIMQRTPRASGGDVRCRSREA